MNSHSLYSSPNKLRIFFFADSHLGFDDPVRPKIERRRRGEDFHTNYLRILEHAKQSSADLVIHGGDMFFRSKVPYSLVAKAFAPLLELADRGIPVVIVPGNHERSKLPVSLFEHHENIFIFEKPQTFLLHIKGLTLSVAGFPCLRNGIRDRFKELYGQTGQNQIRADFKLLVLHQAIEGAVVGHQNFQFRFGPDIIRGRDLPNGINAILSGHIHRAQVLKYDISGQQLNAPVFYAGSIERTSLAERNEVKGYFEFEVARSSSNSILMSTLFHELPVRPMHVILVHLNQMPCDQLYKELLAEIGSLPHDSIVHIRLNGAFDTEKFPWLSAPVLRSMLPKTMNIEMRLINEI